MCAATVTPVRTHPGETGARGENDIQGDTLRELGLLFNPSGNLRGLPIWGNAPRKTIIRGINGNGGSQRKPIYKLFEVV